jgi:unsaturated rhamnogalacturonyl hydrolase
MVKISVTDSPSISAAHRGFCILFAASLLFFSPSLFADELYDFNDFAAFANEWLQSCNSGNGWCNGFDYDISGTVDAEDLIRFSKLWLTSKDNLLSDDIAAWILHTGVSTAKWNYDAGFILLSLYEKWQSRPNPLYLKLVKDWVDTLVDANGSIQPSYYDKENYILDHIQPGNLLLILYEHFGTAKYKLAIDNLIDQLTDQPTTTDGGFWHKNSYKYQMWLDGIYMAEPFACGYAQMFNDPNWYDVAGFQCTLIATHTQKSQIYPTDSNHLCYHGWADRSGLTQAGLPIPSWSNNPNGHSPEFWGRAMGWYAMALVDCLDIMPTDDPCRPQMITILSDLAESLADYQDPNDGPDANNGMWWQVVDKGYPRATYPTNYTETSCTAMFSYALARAVEQGYLPADPYLAVSRIALESLVAYKLTYVGGYISLKDTVLVGSLSGAGNYAYYVSRTSCPLVTNDYKGVGAFMRAALQYEKMTPPAQ